MLQVGDIVKVVNSGEGYTTYCDFFRYYNITQYLPYYGYYKQNGESGIFSGSFKDCKVSNDMVYEIQFIGKHTERPEKGDIAVISTLDYDKVFLIGINGIKKVEEI